nr:protein 2K [Donggang virus]
SIQDNQIAMVLFGLLAVIGGIAA